MSQFLKTNIPPYVYMTYTPIGCVHTHKHTHTFLTHWLFRSVLLRESILRQVDKKSRGP